MLSSTVSNKILKSIVGKDATYGSAIFVGLSFTNPAAENGIVEPQGNGYSRVLIGAASQSYTQKFGDPVDGVVTNIDDIYFPESTGPWTGLDAGAEPLRYFFFATSKDGTAAEDILAFDELQEAGVATPVTVAAEKTVVMFRKGQLKIRFQEANS